MTRAAEVELRLELLDVVHRLTRAEAHLIDRDLDAAVESIAAARQTAQRLADALLARDEASREDRPATERGEARPPTDDPAVEVVRKVQEHFLGTREAGHDLLGESYVWDMSHFSGWPEDPLYEGADGFARMSRDWNSAWKDLDWVFEERFMGADGRVVTFVRQWGRPRDRSRPRIEMTHAIVSTVEGGKVLRDDVYDSWRGALAAVGGARR